MRGGSEWIIDAEGCDADKLSQLESLRAICHRIVTELELHVVGEPQWHQFPEPSGVTGMYLLSESHLTCHSFPESGFVTFNLFCCRPKPAWDWERMLRLLLGAQSVLVRHVERDASDDLSQLDNWGGEACH